MNLSSPAPDHYTVFQNQYLLLPPTNLVFEKQKFKPTSTSRLLQVQGMFTYNAHSVFLDGVSPQLVTDLQQTLGINQIPSNSVHNFYSQHFA